MATVFFRAWTQDHARGTTSVPYVEHLRSIGESWAAALRRWASHGLPCQETKHYLGNFLSVYRVRPAADAKENSDDDGADEALELTEDLLPTALQTLQPAQHEKKMVTSEHAQSAVSVTGFKLAEQAWYQARTIQETQWDATDFEQLDPKALLKATRNAGRQVKRSERSDPAVPAVDAATRVTAGSATAQQVERWAERLPQDVCNPEQKQFCKVVAKRVAAELEMEPHAVAMEDPLRWVLHGGPGTGKSYTLNLIRKGLFEDTLGWQQGVQYQVVTFQAVTLSLSN